MAICQWAERRAQRLDGLAEELEALAQEQTHLSDWLDLREAALGSLRSAHHLDTEQQVLEQVQHLQSMEADLEAEHGRFVHLSQLSSQVVSRLDGDNSAAANDVRRRLEHVTERWDNLVTRLEEHSQMVTSDVFR
jgi:hypothetical protein